MIVTARSHSPLSCDPTARVPWADVRLTWRVGRETCRAYPTLVGRLDMERDQRGSIEIRRDTAKAMAEDWYADSMAETRRARAAFRRGKDWYIVVGEDCACPTVYSRHDDIGIAEAEDMLRGLLSKLHGVRGAVSFRWPRPRIVVIPVSV